MKKLQQKDYLAIYMAIITTINDEGLRPIDLVDISEGKLGIVRALTLNFKDGLKLRITFNKNGAPIEKYFVKKGTVITKQLKAEAKKLKDEVQRHYETCMFYMGLELV